VTAIGPFLRSNGSLRFRNVTRHPQKVKDGTKWNSIKNLRRKSSWLQERYIANGFHQSTMKVRTSESQCKLCPGTMYTTKILLLLGPNIYGGRIWLLIAFVDVNNAHCCYQQMRLIAKSARHRYRGLFWNIESPEIMSSFQELTMELRWPACLWRDSTQTIGWWSSAAEWLKLSFCHLLRGVI
jgi:hypothetical protein